MARPFLWVLSMGAALIMLGCNQKNNTPERSNPVSGTAASGPAASGSTPPPVPITLLRPILATGSNPDWSIRIDTGSMTIKGFEGSLALYPAANPQVTPTSAQFSVGAGANVAALTLQPGPCGDPPISAMTATARIHGRSGTGCAIHAENPATADAPTDWANGLFEVLPSIRACLTRSEGDRAYAQGVEPRPSHTVFMHLRYADTTAFACTASDAAVTQFEAAPDPSEATIATPAFALSAAAFAPLGCEEAPIEVFGAAGEVLGYLQRGVCSNATPAPQP